MSHLHEAPWLAEEKTVVKVIARVYSRLCSGLPRNYQVPGLIMPRAKCLTSHFQLVEEEDARGLLGACRMQLSLGSVQGLCSSFSWLRVRRVWGLGAVAGG